MSDVDVLDRPRVWTSIIEMDENGEAFIEFPPELIDQLGWKAGDEICWRVEGRTAILTKGPCECDEPSAL